MRNYKYFWSLTPGLAVVCGNVAGGWWGISNFVFSMGFLAIIEWFFPEDKNNESSNSAFIPDFILVLHVLMQSAALLTLFYSIHENNFTPWQLAFAYLSTGVHSGSSSIFHYSHYIIASLLLMAVLFLILGYSIGIIAIIAFSGQSLVANFLLEYTNYIEHYGLSRNDNERVTEIHSWQSDKVISRFILIDLSRHSDHHFYASKPYHTLMTYEKSPVLPGGYASAIYLALIPPLWFKVMNNRIASFQKTIS